MIFKPKFGAQAYPDAAADMQDALLSFFVHSSLALATSSQNR